jgi:hypothetical protein
VVAAHGVDGDGDRAGADGSARIHSDRQPSTKCRRWSRRAPAGAVVSA